MYIKDMDFNKALFTSKELGKNDDAKVTLAGAEFRMYSPNFNGGIIESNCRHLHDEDFNIINTLEKKKLDEIEKELNYLKELVQKRKSELVEPQTITKLYTNRYKDGNKKMVDISVEQYTLLKDIYGDTKEIDSKTLEHHSFSDTKAYQEEIETLRKELEEKYNLVQ